MAADLATQFDELRRAHAGHPRPVLATTLDCLCMQHQLAARLDANLTAPLPTQMLRATVC
jgi:hypothetical protein